VIVDIDPVFDSILG